MSLSTLSVATPFTLANSLLQLVVRPDLGGRIDQLHDRRTGRDWLWHPDAYEVTQSRSLSLGSSFDQNWTGGWDEIFPNDAAGPFQGWELVDHGELWSQAWTVLEASDLAITLQYQCQTVPVLVTKTIILHPTSPEATLEYEFRNQSDQDIPFLFKQHCAIAIHPGDEILLPECWVEPAFIEFSKVIGRAAKTRFPKAFAADGAEVDLRVVPPPTSQLQEFYYSSDLAIGQCGIYHSTSRSRLLMQFEQADFPYVWMFQSFGGWRDFYMVVMEPCTTLPYDLEIACQQGTVARLAPHEVQRRSLMVKVELAE